MTSPELVRRWALALRDLSEQDGVTEVVVTFAAGRRLIYDPTVGLSVESPDGGAVFPNEWIDGERWELAA